MTSDRNGSGWVEVVKVTAQQVPALLVFSVAVYMILNLFVNQAAQITASMVKINESIGANTSAISTQTEVMRQQVLLLEDVRKFQVEAFREAERDRSQILQRLGPRGRKE